MWFCRKGLTTRWDLEKLERQSPESRKRGGDKTERGVREMARWIRALTEKAQGPEFNSS